MTLVNTVGMGDGSLTMGVSLAPQKDLKAREIQTHDNDSSQGGTPNAEHGFKPTFSMSLSYSLDSTGKEEHYERDVQSEKIQDHNAPYCAGENGEEQAVRLNSQVIAGLKNKISEAGLYGGTYGNPQLQMSILTGALSKAQTLIKDYMGSLGGNVMPLDGAGYIADLGRLHHQIIQSLSEVAAKNIQKPALARQTRGQPVGAQGSPFQL